MSAEHRSINLFSKSSKNSIYEFNQDHFLPIFEKVQKKKKEEKFKLKIDKKGRRKFF